MNADNCKTYTRITANFVLKALGYEELYTVSAASNPFHFVNDSLLNTVIGFFDTDSADYGMVTDHHYESDSDPEDD
jgi:ribonucleotide reductase beta subunit family protein with ferritin-like domain